MINIKRYRAEVKRRPSIDEFNDWNPGIKQFVLNPNYYERKELYHEVKKYAVLFTGVLLDIGAGEKPYKELFLRVKNYVALEVKKPNNHRDKEYIVYNGTDIPLKENSVDGIVSFQSIYQIEKIDNYLRNLITKLKVGGYILISCPFAWFDSSNNVEQRFSIERLSSLLEQNGISILVTHKTNTGFRGIFLLANSLTYQSFVKPLIDYKYTYLSLRILLTTFFNLFSKISATKSKKNAHFYIDAIVLGVKQ